MTLDELYKKYQTATKRTTSSSTATCTAEKCFGLD